MKKILKIQNDGSSINSRSWWFNSAFFLFIYFYHYYSLNTIHHPFFSLSIRFTTTHFFFTLFNFFNFPFLTIIFCAALWFYYLLLLFKRQFYPFIAILKISNDLPYSKFSVFFAKFKQQKSSQNENIKNI